MEKYVEVVIDLCVSKYIAAAVLSIFCGNCFILERITLSFNYISVYEGKESALCYVRNDGKKYWSCWQMRKR